MKKNNKRLSVRSKIFVYVAGFALGLLVLLWLFQVVFLDNFYRYVKGEQIKSITSDIADNIDDESIDEYINGISENSDYCIRIVDLDSGKFIYENSRNSSVCGFLINDVEEINQLYAKAKENDGTTLVISEGSSVNKIFEKREDTDLTSNNELNSNTEDEFGSESIFKQPPMETFKSTKFQTMTYAKISASQNGNYFVLVNAKITIVSEIADTIRTQLIIISGILLIASLLIAYLISTKISKPIVKINENAKRLANQDFTTRFEGKGYLEIEELADTLNYAQSELSKVESLRNELIANMSHDLRTPLTMIAGYGEVMRDLPGENTPENVQVIIDECNRLTSLVNDILDLSKIQSGTQSLEKHEFNITQVIQDIVKRFSVLLKNDQYKIEFIYDQECMVNADEVKLNQVIYNLMVNAIHYTGEDNKIIVRQSVHEKKVLIEVIDHGEGISKENLVNVWDRYYKLDKVHKRAQVGSGLGLSIVKGILELHKATYGVTSKENEGTTFYFEIECL